MTLAKISLRCILKYYEHMIQGGHFTFASVFEISILTILKATQVSKAAGLDNLPGRFLKDRAKFLSKPRMFFLTGSSTSTYAMIATLLLMVVLRFQTLICHLWLNSFYDWKIRLIMINNVNIFTIYVSLL